MPIVLAGSKQVDREVTTPITPSRIWAVLVDARLLSQWAGPVDHVDSCEADGERVGAVRHCQVRLGGRTGRIVERCVGLIPGQAIAYAVDEDSFGLSRMFAHYSFRISITCDNGGPTRVRMETFYSPRTTLFAVLNVLVMRRRFRVVVDELLAGLVQFAAHRDTDGIAEAVVTAPASASERAGARATAAR